MTKGRMINQKIRSSQTFAKFTYRQRDLWQGLIEVADDQGRMPGSPAYIRSRVWPYDDISLKEIADDLKVLKEAGNIFCYSYNGGEYIQIINWHVYQCDAEWLGASDYPAPPGWMDHARYHSKGNQIVTLNWENRNDPVCNDTALEIDSSLPTSLPTPLPTPLPDRDGDGDGDGDIQAEKTPPILPPAQPLVHPTRKLAKEDMLTLTLRYAAKQQDKQTTLRLETFPEDVREIIGRVCELWNLTPPQKKGGARASSDLAYWIQGARDLREACGDIGMPVIEKIREDYLRHMNKRDSVIPYTVESPKSLVRVARSTYAVMSQPSLGNQGGDASQTDLDNYLKSGSR